LNALALTEDEQRDLVSFLESLSGETPEIKASVVSGRN
jgi:cytochrome c1